MTTSDESNPMAVGERPIAEPVLDRIDSSLQDSPLSGPLSASMQRIVDGARQSFQTRTANDLLCVSIPIAMAGTDDSEATISVAAACTAAYLGARLLDDQLDGHEISYIERPGPDGEIMLSAVSLIILAEMIVARLQIDGERHRRLTDEMSSGLLTMAAGQFEDVGSFGQVTDPESVISAIRGKTGSTVRTFARCGIVAGSNDQHDLQNAGEFGLALGSARQMIADCQKLLVDEPRLTTNRSCSYPVALHAAGLANDERTAFESLYQDYLISDGVGPARESLAGALGQSRAVEQTAMRVRYELAQAEVALGRLRLDPQGLQRLRSLIETTYQHVGGMTWQ